jgi:hypothetical protein
MQSQAARYPTANQSINGQRSKKMATKKFDAVATVGEYTDSQGNKKKRYLNVGAVFENNKGDLSLKIESIPVGGDWNGWVSFYVTKESQPRQDAKPAANKHGGGSFSDMESDIPFINVGRGISGHCYWG